MLWLNELQGFLDQVDGGLGEDIAAALRDLVGVNGSGPILVVGTLWPDHWRRLSTDPPPTDLDRHAQARALLAGRDVRIPDRFTAQDQRRAEATGDPRWKEGTAPRPEPGVRPSAPLPER